MAARFALYYWPIPFRAQCARYVMAYAGAQWHEADRDAVMAAYQAPVDDQPLPFMGPPLLHDAQGDVWVSQAPAVVSYLAEVLELMPGTPAQDALARKVVSDCIDVLHALTLDGGAQMWTDAQWQAFADQRLPRWLQIFEALGHRHGLGADRGTLLGTSQPGMADLACAALWVTITDCLPALAPLIAQHAPHVLALSHRIADTPAISALRADQKARWGDVWCSGQIEASLRSVLANWAS